MSRKARKQLIPAVLGGASNYDPAAQAIFNAFTTPPTAARKTLINNLVVSLKNAGVWSTLDALYVMAAADNQAARINWASPATLTLSPINSPTFTADRGYSGDAASAYINTGVNLGPATTKAVQNSHAVGVFVQAAGATDGASYGGSDMGMFLQNSIPNISTRSANTAADTLSGVGLPGMFHWSRSGSASYSRYKNAVSQGDATSTSAAFASQSLFLLARNNGSGTPLLFSSHTLGIQHIGSALTGAQVTNAYSAFLTYMQAVGAA